MKKLLSLFCILLLVLTGCSAPPQTEDPATPPLEVPSEPSAVPEIDRSAAMTQLKNDLTELTRNPRPLGSAGEAQAANYLVQRFTSMGYAVTRQEYATEYSGTGTNVIAVRENSGDILVISAHHDSFPTSFGANDNGSGVAALLQIAQQLAQVETDTELRFISFTDEENGKNGSRYYVESLTDAERDRMVGCLQLDMLGGLGSDGSKVYTTDGSANWLSDLLMTCDNSLTLDAETASDHASFQLAGIPAVMISQNGQGYLYHSAGDTAGSIDLDAVYAAVETAVSTLRRITAADTGSYQTIAKEQAENYVYTQTRKSRILFSASRQDNEAYLGFTGKLVDSWQDSGDFWTDHYEVYQYEMGWFGGDKLMTTRYIYRNDYLENVEILPGENGYTTDQMYALICKTHGQPKDVDETARAWNWEDELYGKYISLDEQSGHPLVKVFPFSLGISNILGTYEVLDGQTTIEDPQHAKVWELYCKALPVEYRQKIGQFQLFTDGYSNMLAYTSTLDKEDGTADNTRFNVTVDYYDAFDEFGQPRDQSKLLFTLIHEYGHVLLECEEQIDLTKGADVHDPAAFIEGSFRQRYYEAFWQDPYQSVLGSYWEFPEHYVSGYAGNMFHEDIAETFAVFVFAEQPTGSSVAQQKLNFFWAEDAMVALRADIRSGLGLH